MRLLARWLAAIRAGEILVVIWGRHSPDWMDALAASAAVWKQVPFRCVVVNRSGRLRGVPWFGRWGRRVVVIPLLEIHSLGCPGGFPALIGTPEAMVTLGDKGRFADYVQAQRLSSLCPTAYRSIDEAVFPCVIKRTNLNAGIGVEQVASIEQARRLLQQPPFAGHPIIIQSLVLFQVEYVVHAVCIKGRIIWHVTYAYDQQKLESCKSGVVPSIRRSSLPPLFLKNLEAFLLPLEYSGPCNIDCTWDADERLTVFEINPRLGGSLMRPENTADLAACLSALIGGALGLQAGPKSNDIG